MRRFWQIYVHIVWATKGRSHIIKGQLERPMHSAIRDKMRELSMVPVCVNSAWNHTHSLVSWNPSVSVDDAVEQFKDAAVEKWKTLRQKRELDVPLLQLQDGYSAFSVSPKHVDWVKDYVAKQKKRHSTGKIVDECEIWT
ncbi:hypothetical protein FIV42_24750 [Persicimonas caeni]|uniref:Transposase IS200-like domain-containing protein n=1 Tax=Persicimonas caeni TaxID=2292766 RepID=A0A4Y6Q0T8_PERCE|nr:transposase [Persicimonas caeni]QDG53837.1 hypothetical protein FIV42_24750 [Persicimonas caeni]QED35058.1 hypothetical protein FRD00_24745 [Persicimonas caeni]